MIAPQDANSEVGEKDEHPLVLRINLRPSNIPLFENSKPNKQQTEENKTIIEVKDNGRGFDLANLKSTETGIGLKSIQQTKPGKKYEIVPIWTMEDADGQKGVPESPETQGRFRKYAEQGTFPAVLVLYNSSLAFVALHFVERNRWSTRDYVVEGLCQVKSKVCTENR